jgi:hypothetical protein
MLMVVSAAGPGREAGHRLVFIFFFFDVSV